MYIQQGFVVLCIFVPESRGNGGKPATGFQSKNSMQNFKIGTGKRKWDVKRNQKAKVKRI